jgi:hypothetical protein
MTMMNTAVISFKNKSIPVHQYGAPATLKLLNDKLIELEYNFEFRKKFKQILSIELMSQVAIFQYRDGTKLYLEVS